MNESVRPGFKAIDAEITEEGIVLIHTDEEEAQRSFCEGQLRGYALRLNGMRITWLLPQSQSEGALLKDRLPNT